MMKRDAVNQNPANMHINQPDGGPGAGPGFGIDDVYYTLFRHKWLILTSACLGILAAGAIFLVTPTLYVARAKLMVRYVLDTNPLNPVGQSQMVNKPDWGGNNIMNTELEIVTSLDVAEKTADKVGPETVLAAYGGGNNPKAAAAVIRSGVFAENPRRTDIIVVSFQHPDRNAVEKVLPELLDIYVSHHDEMRLGSSKTDQYYADKLFQCQERLEQTEKELKSKLSQAKVLDLDEAKKRFNALITRLTDELYTAEAELAGRKAMLGNPAGAAVTADSNKASEVAVNPETVEEYTSLSSQLDNWKRSERALSAGYTDAHPSVITARERIKELTAKKIAMEKEHSALVHIGTSVSVDGTNSVAINPAVELGRIKEVTARVTALSTQLSNVQTEAYSVLELEPVILQLVRQRDMEQASYDYYRKLMEQRRTGDSKSAGSVTGISRVQSPTPAYQDKAKMQKMMLAALGGCLGLGLALAFVYDLVFDRSIRRPKEVSRHLNFPLFLSIPDVNGKKHRISSSLGLMKRKRENDSETAPGKNPNPPAGGLAVWQAEDGLHGYSEALRERLITYMEVNKLTHKPKLVGVTNCASGSGTTTLASGLAASLSEIGEGNVLLVDMNLPEGAAHPFYRGKPGQGITSALEPTDRPEAQVQERLYLATIKGGPDERLSTVLPDHFTHLVSRIKASNYDYIIFDMPAVMPGSPTARLAAHMDLVLLVLESEKTGQQAAARANALLKETRANAAVVLNKCHQYVPERLS
jgi:uncharacterized protein involved in exopolysaccharide biosynthesis/Mrp family chromosome partitioning ATPase